MAPPFTSAFTSGTVGLFYTGLSKIDSIPFFRRPRFAPDACGHPDGVDVGTWRHKAGEMVAELQNDEDALRWLMRRGIDRQTAGRHRLGLIKPERGATAMFRPRPRWGLPEDTNPKTGKPKMLFIQCGILVPYAVDGEVVRIRIQRPRADLGAGRQKYYVVPGSRMDRTVVGTDR